ncbi:hypothetical protein [Rosistilla oblonga]|uniref:hypothetical protein n=1 Tax=Rosistilla oblonga TaxID=2527990 RepID=UPI003A973208
MDPFFITCTTCSSRLKVRDESMIGQILACPNCQAMVLVEPPTEDQLTIGRQHDIDSQAITSEAIHEELESEGTFAQPGSADATDADLDGSDSSDSQSVSASFGTAPPAEWQPSSYQGYRQIGLIALVSLIAIVSSAAIFGLFIQSSLNKEQQAAGEIDPAVEDEPAGGEPADDDSAIADSTAEVDEPLEASEPEDAAAAATPAESDGAASPAADAEPESQPMATTEAGDPADIDPAAAAVDNPAADPKAKPPADAANGADRIFAEVGQPAEQPEAGTLEELPPSMQMFSSIFGQGLDLQEPEPKPQADVLKAIRFEPPPELSTRYPAPQSPVDVQQRLRQPLGINLNATTLHASVETISEIVSVPISFDIESLDSAGIKLDAAVSGRYLNTTAGDALREILAKVGCTLQQTGPGQMAVRAAEPQIAKALEPAFLVADLQDPEQIIPLATQLAHLAQDPAELRFDAASGRVEVTGSPQAMWRTALALDALRISRNLPPKLPAAQTSRWLVDGNPTDLPRPDPGAIVLEGDLPRPIEHWLTQVAQPQKARVLIDWPSAWQYGLTPEYTVLPWTSHDSLASLEQELLEPFGLTIRDLGDGNWIVTTEYALAMSPRTVVFSPPIPAETQFLERLAAGAGHESPETFAGVIDPVSRRLITRVSQFLQSQIGAELSANP